MSKNEFNNNLKMDLNETSKHIVEMKSIQPYSTKNEYIYAMKEDLSDWFNSMYDTSLNANNFIDQLKNGVLICEHANNVMREAAFKSFAFNFYDLQQAGIINITNLTVINKTSNKGLVNKNNYNFRSNTPTMKSNGGGGGQSAFAGEYLMYNQEPKMIMIAYDNITNFIKWCRYIVKVKECLMFETEDLTLCKNEKNFILCLLEVARFGSKFGIRVPTIIQLEQEIEAEIEMDKNVNIFKTEDINNSYLIMSKNRFIEEKQPNKEYIKSLGQNDDDLNKSPSPSPPPPNYSRSLELNDSSFSSLSNSASIDKLKDEESLSSSSPSSPLPNNSSSRSNSPQKFLNSDNNNNNNNKEENDSKINSDLLLFSTSGSLASPVSSLTSLTASISQIRDIDLTTDSNEKNEYLDRTTEQFISPVNSRLPVKIPIIKNNNIQNQKLSPEKISFQSLIPNKPENKSTTTFTKNRINSNSSSSIENLTENNKPVLNDSITTITTTTTQVNLHKHVCSIANKCTCEKKFLVDKIGEGKYRIGNTKNIVFIRILKNHIMVRVGGGWDTLENYLDKHDPCRCSTESSTSLNKRYNETKYAEHSNQSNNIILTPVKPITILNSTNSSSGINNNSSNNNSNNNNNNHSNKGVIRVTTISCNSNNNNNISIKSSPNTSDSIIKSKSNSNINYLSYEPDTNRAVDFTDAQLIIERDQQGKHQIGKILLTQQLDGDSSFDINNKIVNKKIEKLKEEQEQEEKKEEENNKTSTTMHSAKNIYFLNALKHAAQQKQQQQQQNDEQKSNHHHFNDNNSPSTYSSIHFNNGRSPINSDSIYSSSLISFSNATNKTESMIKNKMKKLINKIPNSSSSSSSTSSSTTSSKQSFSPSFSIGLRKSPSSTTTTSADISTINTPIQSNTNSPINSKKITTESPHSTTGLLKFTRTNYNDKMPKMIENYNSDNNLLADTPVYTDTRLPPRILRKYQKERSITEASIVPLNQQQTKPTYDRSDIECSSSSCGSTSVSDVPNKHADEALTHGPSSSSHCSETTSTSSSSYTDIKNVPVVLLDPNQSNDEVTPLPSSSSSNLKQNSLSPRITFKSTRTKIKKYKKSKTTDLSRNQEEEQEEQEQAYNEKDNDYHIRQNINTSSDLVNSDFDSLESDDNNNNNNNGINKYLLKLAAPFQNHNQIVENLNDEELNDSLELMTTKNELKEETFHLIPDTDLIIDETKLDDDSLIINEKNIDEKNEKSKTNRAQWDKSRQKIDLMYFNFSKLNENKTNTNITPAPFKSSMNTEQIMNKLAYNRSLSSNNNNNTNTLPNHPKNKRTKNLNLAKEKLYEMKKTIDAKVNLDSVVNRNATASNSLIPKSTGLTLNQLNRITPKATVAAPISLTNNTRTTPRKVKKRSGERSLTTGIILSENLLNNNNKSLANSRSNDLANLRGSNICASSTSISSVCTSVSVNTNNSYAKIQENKLRSRTPNHLSSTGLCNKMHNKTSSSMHNISNFASASNNDESILNETKLNYNGNRKRHDSISSTASSFFGNSSSITANEYKENKAYELRKKSTLMNKITIKNQQQDPIYTRSHPISTKLVVDDNLDLANITIGCLGSYEQKHSAARKRLFAKKNEKTGYDPNMSIGSNGSSNTSSSNTTAKLNTVNNNNNTARQSRPATTCINKKSVITPRSKSNNDLYYELERTNSAQDLIELLNSCDAPAGDLNQYKVMLSECDKLQFHINKLKSEHKMRKSCINNNNNNNNSPNKVVSIKKSPTTVQISKTTISKPSLTKNNNNNKKQDSQLNSAKTVQHEPTNEIKNENDSINSSLVNSMHRRSHSLPSYIAIPVVESKFKNMQ